MNLEKSSKSQVRETLYTTKLRSPGHLRESSLEMKKSIIFGKKKNHIQKNIKFSLSLTFVNCGQGV